MDKPYLKKKRVHGEFFQGFSALTLLIFGFRKGGNLLRNDFF